jgi:hypothetical protein
MNGLESFSDHIETIYNQRQISVNIPTLLTATKQEYIGEVLWLIYGIYIAKFKELLSGVIRATNDEDFLIFALCGRGIIETTATLRYYNKKILSVVKDAKNPDAFSQEDLHAIAELLEKHSRGGRFDWEKFWTSPRKDLAASLVEALRQKQKKAAPQPTLYPSQVSAQTAIENWAKEQPEIVLFYDFFCETVHPNLGSNFMVMGFKDANLQLCGKTVKGIGRSISIEGIQFLTPVVKEAAQNMANLLAWAAMTKPLP